MKDFLPLKLRVRVMLEWIRPKLTWLELVCRLIQTKFKIQFQFGNLAWILFRQHFLIHQWYYLSIGDTIHPPCDLWRHLQPIQTSSIANLSWPFRIWVKGLLRNMGKISPREIWNLASYLKPWRLAICWTVGFKVWEFIG